MWWWRLLDDAFEHRWNKNVKIDLRDKYIPASYETDEIKCKNKLNEIAEL